MSSIDKVDREQWDRVATSGGEVNPFLLWDFLSALEASQSAVLKKGWLPQHIVMYDEQGDLVGCCPLYLKAHSYGEYVFDQSWAEYYAMLGGRYYPKLQSCVPFTPVSSQRLLVKPGQHQDIIVRAMGETLIALADALKLSSLHLTFNSAEEWSLLAPLGFLQRTGIQYHWDNRGYQTFDDFLGDLKQSKRKSIRQERKSVSKQGLRVRQLRGREISSSHWDKFYHYYLNTVDKKWGTAYLTREFFHRVGEALGDRVLLMVAEDNQKGTSMGGGLTQSSNEASSMVAGALNFLGSHAVYGRNWGCDEDLEVKNLHFELCYYQAIEAAISLGLPRVEAGAQGEHKLQRGYLPSRTYSSHYIRDPVLRSVVKRFLDREKMQVDYEWQTLTVVASPFKQDQTLGLLREKLRSYQSIDSSVDEAMSSLSSMSDTDME